ncbi:MAG TPA: hypothetical protein VFG10_07400 [Saprospiraceae bacterium]|nr:hypothetical protein [Saprospiraceae bacterium]
MKSILYIFAFLIPTGINAQDLVMQITNPQVNGNQVTYDVVTVHFNEFIAAQYSITYDTNMLVYNGIRNINLDQLGEENFYGGILGSITTLWVDLTLEGTSVADSTVLYQIVFDMKDGNYGGVCFSQQPLESEFARVNEVLSSYFVMDDCHDDPFEFVITTTSTEEIIERFGLRVATMVTGQKIEFSLIDQQSLAFNVYDLSGNQISAFPSTEYSAGMHALHVDRSVQSGIYILMTEIQHQPVAMKIFFP